MRKIEPADYEGKGLSGRPNPLGLSVAAAQRAFDEMALDVLIPIFNENMDLLDAMQMDRFVSSGDIKGIRIGKDGALETTADGNTWSGVIAADHISISVKPRTLSFSLAASGWTACTGYGGAAYSGGDLWQQSTESAGVTALTCLTVLADNALARQMENDGATALWPETAEGSVTFYVRGAKLTADMALSCLAQETGAPSEPQAPQENGEGEQG